MTDAKKVFADIDFPAHAELKQIPELTELAFKYVYHLQKSSKIISDLKAQSAINFLLENSNNYDYIIEMSLKYEFDKICISVLENLYERLIKLFQKETESADGGGEEDDQTRTSTRSLKIGYIAIAVMCTNVLERFTSKSIRFCASLQQEAKSRSVRVLFNYMNNRTMQEKFTSMLSLAALATHHRISDEFVLMRNMLRSVALTLANMTRYAAVSDANCRRKWKDANAVKNLLFYFERDFIQMDLKVEIAIAIGFLADEDDIDAYAIRDKDVLNVLARMISIASKKIKKGFELNRIRGLDELGDSCSINFKQSQWSLATVLSSLQYLATHPGLKFPVYYDLKLTKYLREIVYHGNEYEKERALYTLWEFCFDQEMATNISNDAQLTDYLARLGSRDDQDVPIEVGLLNRYANGILFQTSFCLRQTNVNIISRKVSTKNTRTIRLVNEKNGKELSLQIRLELEKLNFGISVGDRIDEAIDNSACLVGVLTSGFKYSPECRSEIEYALALNRPILLVLAEENYMPKGWIGDVIEKLEIDPIDFASTSLIGGLEKLVDQLNEVLEEKKMELEGLTYPSETNVSKWNHVDVENWMNCLKVHPGLKASLKSCDGKLLEEIYEMRLQAPYFLLELMKSKIGEHEAMKFSLSDFNYFSRELNSLFSAKT